MSIQDPLQDFGALVTDRLQNLDKRIRELETRSIARTWVEITDVVLAVPSASIHFQNISQSYRHIRIAGLLRSDRADTGESVGVRFNGDVGNHYTSNRAILSHPGSLVTSERFADTFMSLTGVLGNLAPADNFGVVDYFIPGYSEPTPNKSIACISHSVTGNIAAGSKVEISGGTWAGGAITSVLLYPAAGGTVWLAGSRLTMYGLG